MTFAYLAGFSERWRSFQKAVFPVGSFALVVLAGCFMCMGCSSLKVAPAPDSGYIPHPEEMAPWPQRAAFAQRIWFKDKAKFYATRTRFTKICFSPTRTDFLRSPGWWDKLNSAGQKNYQNDTQTMAKYMDDTLRKVFRNDPSNRFEVVECPDKNTIVYEFAIVELRPTKVAINLGGTVLGFVRTGAGLVTAVAGSKGSMAIEVTVRDGRDNALLISWADRRVDRLSLFSFRDFVKYAHARRAVQEWADEVLMDWNTPDTVVIAKPPIITVNPF